MGFGAQGEIRTHIAFRQWLLRPPRLPKLRHLDMFDRLLRTRLSGGVGVPGGNRTRNALRHQPLKLARLPVSPQEHIGGADAIRTHAPTFAGLAV